MIRQIFTNDQRSLSFINFSFILKQLDWISGRLFMTKIFVI